ncbi:hypothetical protein FDO65_10035 [Nakamurella flava]|uniref:HNH endonuclease n=1 Tax=Nakamurella flava TaxID=2576308 RepID=A0A4U6QP60_9ACTN|nr:hypothetical protein [Nakamurella flava]TKV61856.1 hypothetical protein FDO65_10035 [Nakamurella flava]
MLGNREMFVTSGMMVAMVKGFVQSLVTESAAHNTDYKINLGQVLLAGGEQAGQQMAGWCVSLGLMKVTANLADQPTEWELTLPTDIAHNRSAAEIARDRQRQRDNTNPRIRAEVRLRDGDACRWCGVITYWGSPDKRSARVGELDHLDDQALAAGKPGKVTTIVVACRHCNGSRQKAREGWDVELNPPPHPSDRFYSRVTAAYIHKHLGIPVPVTTADDERPDSQSGTAAPERPGPQPGTAPNPRQRARRVPGTRDSADERPTAGAPAMVHLEWDAGPGSPADHRITTDQQLSETRVSRDGSGRGLVGSGRDGPGGDGKGSAPPAGRSRRSRRRGRSRHG